MIVLQNANLISTVQTLLKQFKKKKMKTRSIQLNCTSLLDMSKSRYAKKRVKVEIMVKINKNNHVDSLEPF